MQKQVGNTCLADRLDVRLDVHKWPRQRGSGIVTMFINLSGHQ